MQDIIQPCCHQKGTHSTDTRDPRGRSARSTTQYSKTRAFRGSACCAQKLSSDVKNSVSWKEVVRNLTCTS